MPNTLIYSTDAATLNADGSVVIGGYQYTWNGSVYVKSHNDPAFSTNVTAADADRFAQTVGWQIQNGAWGAYDTTGPHTGGVTPEQVLYIRLAIEKGYTTLDAALTFFGGMHLLGPQLWGFDAQALPSTLSAADAATVLDPYTAYAWVSGVSVRDAILNPSSFADSTADAAASAYPWGIPAGEAPSKAIADAWMNSSNATISAMAAAIDPQPVAGIATPYVVVSSADAIAIEKAYVAFFLRPADAAGFNYYAAILDANGHNVAAATSGFAFSPEYQNTYAGMTIEQRIDAIYMNLFDRHAEPDGMQFWTNAYNKGYVTLNNIALNIEFGAQNGDLTTVNNRAAEALAFTQHLDTTIAAAAYSGAAACAVARSWLSQVTDDPATVQSASTSMGETIKAVSATAFAHGQAGDTIVVSGSGHDLLVLSPDASAGKLDSVYGFAGGTIDLSAFPLATANVQVQDVLQAQTAAEVAFFRTAPTVIEHVGADSYMFIDVDGDGSFDPAKDAEVHFVGVSLSSASLVVA